MSANSQPPKASKWGNFFQQAVAGVESRLDHILSEDDCALQASDVDKNENQVEQQALRSGLASPRSSSIGPSRSPSSAKKNDRLQERLARAMAKQSDTTASSSAVASRNTSPLRTGESEPGVNNPHGKMDVGPPSGAEADNATTTLPAAPSSPSADFGTSGTPREIYDHSDETPVAPRLFESLPQRKKEPDTAQSSSKGTTGDPNRTPGIGVSASSTQETDYEAAMAQLQADHEAAELRWQEEIYNYVEKIDALQSKLKYLAKEAAESARKASTSSDPGTSEKRIAEKDEQIASLMEEGQKLSKVELAQRTTIKKLKQQITENSKSLADSKRRTDNAEKSLAKVEDRAKVAELAERRLTTKLNAQTKIEKELQTVTAERDNSGIVIKDLKSQLTKALARAEAGEQRIKTESVETESRQVAELKDDISSAKIESELNEEKLRREIRDLNEGIKQERKRARLLEVELRGEQSVLESKMETLRARAEEVSSSATGDAQANLLRQIETLQSQYAVASENWHGIESSLLSRLASVEKERDDIAGKEGNLRRKAREANLKAKRIEGELEASQEANQELDRNLEETKKELATLSSRLAKADEELIATKQDFIRQKDVLETTWTRRFEDEKAKWQEQGLNSSRILQAHTESPVALSRGSETLSTMPDRPGSRRSPVLSVPFSGNDTPPRQNSYSSFRSNPALRATSNGMSRPSIDIPTTTLEPEDYFNGTVTPATPSAQGANSQPARGINDIISVSTVAAGPSVQLVERMSATVRQLESERTALKDELARLTAQRDEARQEVVNLMGEVEEKRAGDQKIKELEEAVEQLDQRYQTTLEMLGEKSEQVEEQKADIDDLKKIYRELIERMVK